MHLSVYTTILYNTRHLHLSEVDSPQLSQESIRLLYCVYVCVCVCMGEDIAFEGFTAFRKTLR